MKHFASPEFWAAYGRLPKVIRKQADRHFDLLVTERSRSSWTSIYNGSGSDPTQRMIRSYADLTSITACLA